MANAFRLELLDIPFFARGPDLLQLNVGLTSKAIRAERRSDAGGRSYDPIFAIIHHLVHPMMSRSDVKRLFRDHKDQEWAKHLRTVALAIFDAHRQFKGSWYSVGRKPRVSNGLVIKPAIRGVKVLDQEPFPVLVNARKTLDLDFQALRFLARGVFELHGRDMPNVDRVAIWDVSRSMVSGGRHFSEILFAEEEMLSLEEFDQVVDRFLRAVTGAGYDHDIDRSSRFVDLFRSA